jgi:hypothetical protein
MKIKWITKIGTAHYRVKYRPLIGTTKVREVFHDADDWWHWMDNGRHVGVCLATVLAHVKRHNIEWTN